MSRPAKPARQTWYARPTSRPDVRVPAEPPVLSGAAPALLAAAWRSHETTIRFTLAVPLRPKTKSWVGTLVGFRARQVLAGLGVDADQVALVHQVGDLDDEPGL